MFFLTYLYLIMLNSECKLQYSLCSCKIVILSFIRLNHSNVCTYEHSYYMSCVLYCYFGTWQYYVSFASNKIFKSIICNDKELEMYVSLASSYYSIIVSFIYCNTASDQYDTVRQWLSKSISQQCLMDINAYRIRVILIKNIA